MSVGCLSWEYPILGQTAPGQNYNWSFSQAARRHRYSLPPCFHLLRLRRFHLPRLHRLKRMIISTADDNITLAPSLAVQSPTPSPLPSATPSPPAANDSVTVGDIISSQAMRSVVARAAVWIKIDPAISPDGRAGEQM